MTNLNALDWVAIVLTIIGGINWGLIGVFGFNLVAAIFGTGEVITRIIYVLVGLAAIWLIFTVSKIGANTPTTTTGGPRS